MESGIENVQIDNEKKWINMMVLVGVLADIHLLIEDEGLRLQEGLIIFIENSESYCKAYKEFLELGAMECKRIEKKHFIYSNNKMVIHRYHKYDGEKEVLEFLGTECFTPILLIHGIVPEFLQGKKVVPYGGDGFFWSAEALQKLSQLKMQIHQYPERIQRQLKLYKTSEHYMKNCYKSIWEVSFGAVIEVCNDFFREHHSDVETKAESLYLHTVVEYYANLVEDYAEECEVLDVVKKAIRGYISEMPQIVIANVEEIEGEVTDAILEERVILFDRVWYYFSEKILRSACEPMLSVVSVAAIKGALFESGFLYCNKNAAGTNFTTKKLLTNVYGHVFRTRFLKISKSFLARNGELGIEERGEERCSLECVTKKDVI